MSLDSDPLSLIQPNDTASWHVARELVEEYVHGLGVDVSFQQPEAELAQLQSVYAPPHGAFLLARIEGSWAGCCALRGLADSDYPNAAEMKRLYVRPAFRRFGLGRALTEGILDAARLLGHHTVLLDTLDDMEAARSLYAELGFVDIPPYYHNPIAGAHYLKVDL